MRERMRRGAPRLVVGVLGLAGALLAAGTSTAAAQAGTVSGGKTVADADIGCGGSTTVAVTLDGQTGIAGNPVDVVLVLDRSGSMASAIGSLKTAAKGFVDLIDEATDGSLDGVIANGSRVGVVSFSSAGTVNVALASPASTSSASIKAAVDALSASGSTNHADAITDAQAQLAGSNPASSKTMIIFTDGQSTVGGNGQAQAAAARGAGTEIFAIGLGSVNVGQLNGWATDPDSQHVFIAPGASDLDAIFQAIGAAIVVPAATGITVVDTVHGHFSVTGAAATKGSVAQAGNVLTWTIGQLDSETVTLSYTITHDAARPGGTKVVNPSLTYSDSEGKAVAFPSPTVNVRGCAATIDLAPPSAVNELGTPGQTHSVTATVSDDFGDPVAGVLVGFSILSGPNGGGSGSGTTDATGQTPFTYTAAQGLAGLGQDAIQGCFTNGASQSVCDGATKDWVDTTAPSVTCAATTNPSGSNVPPAGDNPKSGQNPDGFYVLTATDAVDPNPTITVVDGGSTATFGPFTSGTKVKVTQAPGATPTQKPGAGGIDWHITLKGDASVTATDASGNTSAPVACLVPPLPK